jgi:hypothetical protein
MRVDVAAEDVVVAVAIRMVLLGETLSLTARQRQVRAKRARDILAHVRAAFAT